MLDRCYMFKYRFRFTSRLISITNRHLTRFFMCTTDIIVKQMFPRKFIRLWLKIEEILYDKLYLNNSDKDNTCYFRLQTYPSFHPALKNVSIAIFIIIHVHQYLFLASLVTRKYYFEKIFNKKYKKFGLNFFFSVESIRISNREAFRTLF